MTDLVLRPLADAFMQVGVYVAVMVAGFGWLRWRYGERFTDGLTRRRGWGPLTGAILGATPGCGGAIILMPLYARGKVSFGTVIAALVATMGDSSWVVIAADPVFALRLHLLLLVVGLVSGYAVDALGIAPPTRQPVGAGSSTRQPVGAGLSIRQPVGAGPTDGCDSVDEPSRPAGRASPAPALPMSTAFWGLSTPGFIVSILVVFQLVDATVLTEAFGGVDPYLLLGVAGTLLAVIFFVNGRGRFVDDTVATAQPQSMRQTLRHSAHEASFITVWVAVAYLGWEIITATTGFDGGQLLLAGIAGVAIGALIGLIPGCAVQIVFTGLYVSGGVPLPTLVANAVSQDGDALIPLAALRPRAAVLASVITTVPAVLTGAALLALF